MRSNCVAVALIARWRLLRAWIRCRSNCLAFALRARWRLRRTKLKRRKIGALYYRRSHDGAYPHFAWCDRYPNPRHIVAFVPLDPGAAPWWRAILFRGRMRWGDPGPWRRS